MADFTKRAGHGSRRNDSYLKEASVFGIGCLLLLSQSPAYAAQQAQTPTAGPVTAEAAPTAQPPKLRKAKKLKRVNGQTTAPAGTPLAPATAADGQPAQGGAQGGAQIQGVMTLPRTEAAPDAAAGPVQPAAPLQMGAGAQTGQPAAAAGGHTLPAAPVQDAGKVDPNANTGPVRATAPIDSAFKRDRNVSVSERPHPEYAALGLRFGSFVGAATLTSDLTYDDNIFPKTPISASDVIVHFRPQVTLSSDWGRNSISAYVRAVEYLYTQHSNQSTTDVQAGVDARVDLQALSSISFGSDGGVFTVPRTDASTYLAATKPYQYTRGSAYVQGVQEMNRWRFTERADFSHYDYDNAVGPGGVTLVEDFQNHDSYTLSGKAEYATMQNMAVFVNFRYLDLQYLHALSAVLPAGSSTGYEATFGADFDLSHVARGSVEVGYLQQTFRFRPYGRDADPTFHVRLEWFPTQLTTVTFKADRLVQEWAIVGSGGSLGTLGSVQVDHELWRNLRLTASTRLAEYDYRGVDRRDLVVASQAGATYLMNRRVGLSLNYTRLQQWSSGAQKVPDFADNQVALALTLQY
jgi:hypothetical protein